MIKIYLRSNIKKVGLGGLLSAPDAQVLKEKNDRIVEELNRWREKICNGLISTGE